MNVASRLAVLATLVCAPLAAAHAAIPPGAVVDEVNGTLSSPAYTYTVPGTSTQVSVPSFGWQLSYDRYFDGTDVVKHVEIAFNFAPALGFTEAQQLAWKSQTEDEIESIWNGKFRIDDIANDLSFGLRIDVTLEGPFDQAVTVAARPGDCNSRPNALDCRDSMIKWFADSSDATKAHEFGHMIGLYDEYLGGAVDRAVNPTLSNDGLMGLGAVSDDPVMYSRYYAQFLQFLSDPVLVPFEDYNRLVGGAAALDPHFVLSAVPEPGTWALLTCGLLVTLAAGRRRSSLH